MARRQYIGARYVIKVYENSQVAGSAEWEEDTVYEPLVLVTYQNGSYLSKKYVPSTVGNPAANTDYWVQTGFYNGQIANLQHQIDTINEALSDLEGDFDALEASVNNAIANIEAALAAEKINYKTLTGNLILNDIYDFVDDGLIDGSCYVGNGRIVAYFRSSSSGTTGKIKCYNLYTYTKVWEHNVTGYHGNNITYNPNNNHIYICGCINDSTNTPINAIVEIDLDNPGVVIREITLPVITSCYSLCFDPDTNLFYSIAYSGTTAGTADMLYVFNEALTEVVRTVQLENYPAVVNGISAQGAQLGKNGIVYIPTYAVKDRAIYGYNTTNGKVVSISAIPAFINKCRGVGELQTIMYDFDLDRYIVGSVTLYTGVYRHHSNNYFEVDMNKGIAVYEPVPAKTLYDIETAGQMANFNCVMAGNSLRPSWLIDSALITVPNDAFMYSRLNGCDVDVAFVHSQHGVSETGGTLNNMALNGFKGRINGYSDARLAIRDLEILGPCDVTFLRCHFNGFEATKLANGYYTNVFLQTLARAFFQNCTFDSYEASGNHKHHIIAYNGATAWSFNNTYEGTVDNNHLTALGGTVITE